MRILDLAQGSPEWEAERARYHTASEASAMMGAAKKTSRAELLRMKATGTKKEFSEWVQKNLLDNGHKIEAAARPIAEKIIGETLYPATAVDDAGNLLASYDGLTMLETTAWECKSWNEDKAAAVREGRVPEEDYWQVVQQLCVGAERVLYMVTDGTEENTVYVWKELGDGDREKLEAGWKLFDEDLANYQHVEPPAPVVANPVKALPTLFIQAHGGITNTNMPEFKAEVTAYLGSIAAYKKPTTDQEFADGKAIAANLREAAIKLKERREDMLSQTITIGEMARDIDALVAVLNTDALAIEKAVEAEEKRRKNAMMLEAQATLNEHLAKLDARLGGQFVPRLVGDWAGKIKGKRLLSSMQDAIHAELAAKRLEADAVADRIEANAKQATDCMHLFPDFAAVCNKAPEDFAALLFQRQEQERQRIEAERERIRQEEAERIAREAAHADAQAKAQAAQTARGAEDQRGKTAEATHAEPVATATPQAPAASTPPVQDEDAILDWYMTCVTLPPEHKKVLRGQIKSWEKFKAAAIASGKFEAAA
ncbi:MAG: YqaJ viral recombinase family protein [Mizugakiibacter sp.]|uniref:YqaJ viral recombinase family protein n=1 Tax=Mizugakiibacter sp. TaxID=1972610 RepID=UPI00320D7362